MTPFRLIRRVVSLVVTVVLAALLIVAGDIWWTARQDERRRSDVIVVLGASQYDGRPSAIFAARLDHARALYRDGIARRIITVGGAQQGDRFTEAAAGRRYLVNRRVPAGRVLAVEKGEDTLGSLRAVADLMERHRWDSAVLVTDPWHSMRARAMARDLGLHAVSSPARHGPAVRTRETQVRYIGRETVAYLYYRLIGAHLG